jgi:hypothetical protein
MLFKDKTIFIISYENWGKMLMSKHHYALELAKMGNRVFFINHPDKRKELRRGEVRVEPTEYGGLQVVRHRLFHPYFLKFKLRLVYNFFIRLHIQKIIKTVGQKPDVVWSFDSGNTLPLKLFPSKSIRILMPVDGPFWHKEELLSAEEVDVIISVTPEILSRFERLKKPMLLLGHGVSPVFFEQTQPSKNGGPVRIGYSGSLIRSDLDVQNFLKIIKAHPQNIFEFWGEYDPFKSNIHMPQDVQQSTLEFINELKALPNVKLHGPVHVDELAKGIQGMDAFLICYNIKSCQNSHKILEYLSTGKVIISNHFSFYEGENADLLEMIDVDGDSTQITELFTRVINHLDQFNSSLNVQRRISFAKSHAYSENIKKIQDFVNANK